METKSTPVLPISLKELIILLQAEWDKNARGDVFEKSEIIDDCKHAFKNSFKMGQMDSFLTQLRNIFQFESDSDLHEQMLVGQFIHDALGHDALGRDALVKFKVFLTKVPLTILSPAMTEDLLSVL